MSSFSSVSLNYVCRSTNSAAHKFVLRVDTVIVWRIVYPNPIEAIVTNELVH
ncbi:hypothetical protein CsatB_028341 [Cannabis sativa]